MSSKKLKKAARARMKETGENYTTARAAILEKWANEKAKEVSQ
jgi:hypothetical protein